MPNTSRPEHDLRRIHPAGGPVGLGCGLLIGFLLGAYAFVSTGLPDWTVLGFALTFAGLAYWYGDRFWSWLAAHIHWFS